MNLIFWRPVLLVFCWFGLTASAAPLVVGDALPAFSASDQHGREFSSTNALRYLLVVTEMACGKTANLKLAEQGASFLETNHAAYLMDIHRMPAMARLFALPKMRKYPQRIVLMEAAETLAMFPKQAGRVTVLSLTTAGRIRKISYWDPVQEPVVRCFD